MPTRVDADRVAELNQEITLLKRKVERYEVLKDGKDTPLWKILGPAIKAASDATQKKVIRIATQNNSKPEDLADIRLAAGEALGYERIYTDVEDADKKIEKANQDISLIRQKIMRAKKQGGLI